MLTYEPAVVPPLPVDVSVRPDASGIGGPALGAGLTQARGAGNGGAARGAVGGGIAIHPLAHLEVGDPFAGAGVVVDDLRAARGVLVAVDEHAAEGGDRARGTVGRDA